MKIANIRFLLFTIATAFIVSGISRGESQMVLEKGIKLCLECVGIG